jgi:nitronate monooxygenase
VLDRLSVPIVQAPLAGGASTPALAAAVSGSGGLGFVAAGYRSPQDLRADVAETRELTSRPFGVNLFVPGGAPTATQTIQRYASSLEAEVADAGEALGEPRFDDDRWEEKLAVLAEEPPAVVSFTFGSPPADLVGRLHAAGAAVWVTVTNAAEARDAAGTGADGVVVQGAEAGGHRASFVDSEERDELGLLAVLQLVREAVDLPMIAAGGIATGAGVAAVLAAGASAAQVGTAFMLCPEAGTSAAHRDALSSGTRTALTRAFSGRLARGVVNRFLQEHSADAPRAYPEVHHLTAPLRARGRETGDPEVLNLWAGQAHQLAREEPAAEVVARLGREAGAAIDAAARRIRV